MRLSCCRRGWAVRRALARAPTAPDPVSFAPRRSPPPLASHNRFDAALPQLRQLNRQKAALLERVA